MHEFYLPPHALKGRGIAHAVPHRFERDERVVFDDGWGTAQAAGSGQGANGGEATPVAAFPATQVRWEEAKSALTRNDSPDIGFMLGLAPLFRDWLALRYPDRACSGWQDRQALSPTPPSAWRWHPSETLR